MADTASITVSIVEDNRGMRESLADLLRDTPGITCVSTHGTAEEALLKLPLHRPRVVLMDINLPRMSGVECLSHIKAQLPETEVVMLTVHEDTEAVFNSLRAGATGYLLKTAPLSEIIDALIEIKHGGVPMSAAVARRVVKYFSEQPKAAPEVNRLTSRENEILEMVARGAHDKEIADKLAISVGGVRNHLQRIYRKLHVTSRTAAVHKLRGQ